MTVGGQRAARNVQPARQLRQRRTSTPPKAAPIDRWCNQLPRQHGPCRRQPWGQRNPLDLFARERHRSLNCNGMSPPHPACQRKHAPSPVRPRKPLQAGCKSATGNNRTSCPHGPQPRLLLASLHEEPGPRPSISKAPAVPRPPNHTSLHPSTIARQATHRRRRMPGAISAPWGNGNREIAQTFHSSWPTLSANFAQAAFSSRRRLIR